MPLYDAFSQREYKQTPFPETFALLERLSPEERGEAEAKINEMIDSGEIFTSSWMPGSDWSGTSFEPIWKKAAKWNQELAAKIFGVLVFDVFRRRPEDWYTGRFEKDGIPLRGRTYFKPDA